MILVLLTIYFKYSKLPIRLKVLELKERYSKFELPFTGSEYENHQTLRTSRR
jgi:hypothetical protein